MCQQGSTESHLKMNVSVLILTHNEESNIGACIESVRWSNDVVVLDSLSTDRTTEIAEAAGARVFHKQFCGYASQRNFGLQGIDYKNTWVLMLDADERATPELADEILTEVSNASDDIALYRLRRKDHFMNCWIRYSSGYPTWFGRLVKPSQVRVEREINEEYVTDGEIRHLQSHLIHYPFSKGVEQWIERHNRYSTMEAKVQFDDEESGRTVPLKYLFNRDPMRRRSAQKQLVGRLPGRSWIVFFLFYLARGGFLDGRAGLTFSRLKGMYEYMIAVKLRERRLQKDA